MKITIELESLEELAKVRAWLNTAFPAQDIDTSESILKLNLSARTENCLMAENITTLAKLLEYSEVGLLKIPNFGKHSLTEVKQHLSALGLFLRNSRG